LVDYRTDVMSDFAKLRAAPASAIHRRATRAAARHAKK
jgi:hypothetical protein